MSKTLTNKEAELLLVLQEGVPFEPRPFAAIGTRLGMSEAQVLQSARSFINSGLARRFGVVFEARMLGYTSTLCATDIPAGELTQRAASITPHPGITHCYERNGHPNLWFTMTAPAATLNRELAETAEKLAPHHLSSYPALRTFKIGVVLDIRQDRPTGANTAEPHKSRTPEISSRPFSERDRQLVRILQGNIPIESPEPLQSVAESLQMDYEELLRLLADWKRVGTIRRFCLVPRHTEMGFSANAMCAWNAPAAQVETAGTALARSPLVTHCYERAVDDFFPYNLFAMIHARTISDAENAMAALGKSAGLSEGRMMLSVREFKKSSPVYF